MKGLLNLVSLGLALASSTLASAQPRFLWSSYRDLENVTGRQPAGQAVKVLACPAGGYYILGYTYIARYTPDGSLLWRTMLPNDCVNASAFNGGIAIAAQIPRNYASLAVYDLNDQGALQWTRVFENGRGVSGLSSIGGLIGIAADPAGNVYVGDQDGSQIIKYSPTGSTLATFSLGTKGPADLLLTPSGLFVSGSDGAAGFVALCTTAGVVSWVKPLPAADSKMIAGSNGSVILASNHSVYRFLSDGTLAWSTPVAIYSVVATATNSSGYVAVSETNGLHLLDPNGNVLWFKSNYADPSRYALLLDSANRIIDGGSQFLWRTDSQGNTLSLQTLGGTQGDTWIGGLLLTANDNFVGVQNHSTGQIGDPDPVIFQRDANNNSVWTHQDAIGGSFVTSWISRTAADGSTYVLGGPGTSISPNLFVIPYQPVVLAKFTASGRLDWSYKVPTALMDYAHQMELAPGGGVIIAGLKYTLVQNEEAWDGALTRIDSKGKVAWIKTYDYAFAPDALATNSTNIYIAAESSYPAGTGAQVVKLSSTGSMLWSTPITQVGQMHSIALDSSANCYIAGEDRNQENAFVVKVGSTGTPLWAQSITVALPYGVFGWEVKTDNSAVYLRSEPGTEEGDSFDQVDKFAADGTHLWSATADQPAYNMTFHGIAPDGQGGVYVSGVNPLQNDYNNSMVRRIDSTGATLWSKQFAGVDASVLQKMLVDSSSNVYFTAQGGTPTTGVDYLIYKLLPNGAFAWPTTAANIRNHALFFDGGGLDDLPTCLTMDLLGNLDVGGVSYGPNGTTDIHLAKFGSEQSRFVSQSFPISMIAGHTYNVSVTMQNVGLSTWTAGKYSLVPLAAVWGVSAVALAPADSIAPGQSKTFNFVVTAPKAGTISNRWTMRHGATNFGVESALVTVSVSP